jgi:2-oxoglutarate dehydrogenase E2 component (dihydrolipoamide succinyltransferase)
MAGSVEVKIPTLGESVSEGVIVRWLKENGEFVEADEPLLELETDKASVEIPAERSGVVKILREKGETVQVGDVVASIDTEGTEKGARGDQPRARERAGKGEEDTEGKRKGKEPEGEERKGKEREGEEREEKVVAEEAAPRREGESRKVSPLARRVASERGVDPSRIAGTGSGGRVTRADVEAAAADEDSFSSKSRSAPAAAAEDDGEERVPMTPIRRRIAERLVQVQRTAAILTTFNEIDMTAVLDLRKRYKDRFQQTHGVALGFMSFFARACVHALAEVRGLNGEIQGTDLVYHRHVHLGIAVSTGRGLVVPVVRSADRLSFAEIEAEIERLAGKARDGKLAPDDLAGGTFSITNGGVFGSLLSTPIINPPQSGILGMHKIEARPVAIDGQVVVRPMMYVALSYDHRIVDGRDAVTFLVRVKERLEDPSRMLLDV